MDTTPPWERISTRIALIELVGIVAKLLDISLSQQKAAGSLTLAVSALTKGNLVAVTENLEATVAIAGEVSERSADATNALIELLKRMGGQDA